MENTFGLTEEQQAFLLTHYQTLTVTEMRKRLHLGADKVNKFLDARGLTPRRAQQSRRVFGGRPLDGFFNVDQERNWLMDDGEPYDTFTTSHQRTNKLKAYVTDRSQ